MASGSKRILKLKPCTEDENWQWWKCWNVLSLTKKLDMGHWILCWVCLRGLPVYYFSEKKKHKAEDLSLVAVYQHYSRVKLFSNGHIYWLYRPLKLGKGLCKWDEFMAIKTIGIVRASHSPRRFCGHCPNPDWTGPDWRPNWKILSDRTGPVRSRPDRIILAQIRTGPGWTDWTAIHAWRTPTGPGPT